MRLLSGCVKVDGSNPKQEVIPNGYENCRLLASQVFLVKDLYYGPTGIINR